MVSISRAELQNLITAVNSHIEACDDFLSIDLSRETREIMEDQRQRYIALRDKLQVSYDAGEKLIEITYATVPKNSLIYGG